MHNQMMAVMSPGRLAPILNAPAMNLGDGIGWLLNGR